MTALDMAAEDRACLARAHDAFEHVVATRPPPNGTVGIFLEGADGAAAVAFVTNDFARGLCELLVAERPLERLKEQLPQGLHLVLVIDRRGRCATALLARHGGALSKGGDA